MEKVLHHTNQSCEKPVSIPAILCGTKVAITPIDDHMLYGGTMEITGINNKININTVKGIIETVSKLFPNLKVELSEKKRAGTVSGLVHRMDCSILAAAKK